MSGVDTRKEENQAHDVGGASPFDQLGGAEFDSSATGMGRIELSRCTFARTGGSGLGQDSGPIVARYWAATVFGIAVAGGAYGSPVLIIGSVVGFFLAGFFAVALVVPFALAVRALCGAWRHPLAGPCFGGVIGFVSFAAWGRFTIERPADWGAFVVGPILASFLGQAGGYLATRSEMIEMILERQRLPSDSRWGFSTRSALIAMVSVAVLLTLLRRWRPLELRDLYLVAMWLPWQIGMLCLFGRWGRRAAARMARIKSVSRETGGYAILARGEQP